MPSSKKSVSVSECSNKLSPSQMANPNMNPSQSGPFAIFWDIENCPVPGDVLPEDVANNIRTALQVNRITEGGVVTVFSAYGDFNYFPKRVRAGCQRTGVKLVDVPNGHKDAADKAILVDMLLFAMDNRPPSTIMLISGDIDFSPALHILKQRGYTVILVVRSNVCTSSALKNSAQFVWDWPSLARGQGLVSSHKASCSPSSSPAKHPAGDRPSCTSQETQALYNRTNVICVPSSDLNGLKSELVNLLELAGGMMPVACLSVEYCKIYGRPLYLSNYDGVKLNSLLKKMSDAVTVGGKGNKRVVYLRRSRPAPVSLSTNLRRVKQKVNPSENLGVGASNEDSQSQHLLEQNLTKFKHEVEEMMVSHSCWIFLGSFEGMYQLRYKRNPDYRSLGVQNLEELLLRITDVVELQGDPENGMKFLVPVCK